MLVVGALFVVWGIVGLFDMANVPYHGYLTDPTNTVIRVDEGSPADAAGLAVGDRIASINGVSVEDTPALTRMPRAAWWSRRRRRPRAKRRHRPPAMWRSPMPRNRGATWR
jgi:hypothetical protein